jgi:CheY-like chemotaxis protein
MSYRGHIIIVEDDMDDQDIYREVFKRLQVANPVRYFSNSRDAFNFLMSAPERPYLIISDINMPGEDGLQFKQKIDSVDYLRMKSIPFVFLTTSDDEQMILQAYQKTSLQGYFKKGNTVEEISNCLEHILDYWRVARTP